MEQTLAHQQAHAEAAGFRLDAVVADHGVSGVSTTLREWLEEGGCSICPGRAIYLLFAGLTVVCNYRDVTDTIREFMRRGVFIL